MTPGLSSVDRGSWWVGKIGQAFTDACHAHHFNADHPSGKIPPAEEKAQRQREERHHVDLRSA